MMEFVRARTRRQPPTRANLGYAVIDIETTGLRPSWRDRIIEIAILNLDEDLHQVDEWVSLLNPQRDIGPRSIHGISALDVVEAPPFEEIVGELNARLPGRVIVGHHVRFDISFVRAEMARSGWILPDACAGLCTMELAEMLGSFGSRSLRECCRSEGITYERIHTALGDARAAAELLRRYLPRFDSDLRNELMPVPFPAGSLPDFPPRGVGRRREDLRDGLPSSLSALIERRPAVGDGADADPVAVLGYVDLLDRTVEDRVVTEDEAMALAEFAKAHDLSPELIEDLHQSYLTSLVAVALRDQRITSVERDDLARVANAIGQHQFLAKLLTEVSPAVQTALTTLRTLAHAANPAVPPVDRRSEMKGKTVCFTGESVCGFTRETQIMLAEAAGMGTWPRITRRVDILVLADPASQSTKARLADNYGTRQMAERAFWPCLGITIS